jgi:transposase
VTGADGAVRISSGKGSCAAAAVAGGCQDTTGWDAAMVTPPEIEARILRLYHAEKWLIGTIAQQLHVHYSVVGRVLAQAGLPRPGPPPRKSRIDPYLAFIRQTLESFPALTASRLYVMVRERGYRGSPDHFRHLIACHRPRPLMAFVMVLSHSRQIFLRFFPDARMENFLRGHVAAFTAWGGVPRVLLYDNLKSAVLERQGARSASIPHY